MQIDFHESIRLLEGLAGQPLPVAASPGPERVGALLDRLGSPQKALRTINVAGSSGKGSTATLIASSLSGAGFRTGLFRSPHLQSYRERIAIDGQNILEAEWGDTFTPVWESVESVMADPPFARSLGRPHFFDVLFAMACLHFARERVDIAVMEAGMGGRLDATNVTSPCVAVVTNVSLEHTRVLGSTEREIAIEKAAIIKRGSVAATGASGQALSVIRDRASIVGSPLIEVPRDVSYSIAGIDLAGQDIRFQVLGREVPARLGLLGHHQAQNSAVALAALTGLCREDSLLDLDRFVAPWRNVTLPGRAEIVSRNPLVLVDGAQSVAGSQALADLLKVGLFPKPVVLLFGALSDKRVDQMLAALSPVADEVFLTRVPGTARSASPTAVAECLTNSFGGRVQIRESTDDALREAHLSANQGTLVAAGSLYLAGYVREKLRCASALR